MAQKRAQKMVIPENETKEEKSKRLAIYRVNVILDKMDGIVNLATPAYSFTNEEKTSIVGTLSDAVVNIDNAFNTKQVLKESFCI